MRFEITGSVDPLLSVTLEKGEKVLAESNAMVAMDGDLSLKGRSRGGIMKSLARKLFPTICGSRKRAGECVVSSEYSR